MEADEGRHSLVARTFDELCLHCVCEHTVAMQRMYLMLVLSRMRPHHGVNFRQMQDMESQFLGVSSSDMILWYHGKSAERTFPASKPGRT